MIHSMTGFGREQQLIDGHTITVELKSVNSRYFEFNCRLPKGYLFLEDKLKSFVQSRVSRGKIEMHVSIENERSNDIKVEINEAYASAFITAFKKLAKKYRIRNNISTSTFINNSDMFKISKAEIDEEHITDLVLSVAGTALDKFIEMRALEGEKLKDDVLLRVTNILSKTLIVENKVPQIVENYRKKLESKIRELLASSQLDESRIITETAIYADKVAVSEETVRLRSHIQQLCVLCEGDGAVGRKLDFIVQEMNRETNTIGSKVQDIEISQIVVDIKSEIEKIREQIQNIE